MKVTLFAAVAALHSFTFAAPAGRHVQHERRDESTPLIKRSAVPRDSVLPVRIGLTQRNLDRGHDWLMSVSDPKSSKYGQFYTVDEVKDLFAPAEETVAAVRAWLERSGILGDRISQSTNKQWLQFDAETHEVEDLLKTKMHIYEHEDTGKTSVGCDNYHVEEDVQQHIDYITPGVKMIEMRSDGLVKRALPHITGPIKTPYPSGQVKIPATRHTLQHCDKLVTPNCIAAMYQITNATTHETGNELGIFEETPEYLDHADMNGFFQNLAPHIPNGTFPTVHEIDGAKNIDQSKKAGTEALLDFQIAYPIIYPQETVLYLTDDVTAANNFTGGLFNTFLDAIDGSYCSYSAFGEKGNNNTVDPVYPNAGYKGSLQCGVFKPTNVISLSYELAEFNEGTSAAYQKRQCNEYMKLGMQGVSIVFSSGDSGVQSAWGCAGTKKQQIFNPNFPSNCPYVTSVGATTLTGLASKDAERAVTQFPSGGGFSNYFPMPEYQSSAVAAYFASPQAPKYPSYNGSSFGNGVYNRSGRGYPDVAAVGQKIVNFAQGKPYLVGGTSASAPLFASILTRINEERLKAGKSVVGFVNPMLYQNPDAFHDITVGDNKGCGTKGFSCAKGWDPVTGLGTPIYPKLLEAFMGA